jgi:cellobiose-specific phosphotransferase system component IIA
MTSRAQTGTVEAAAEHLYQAELALHDAHMTHEDLWIAAAADRLHEAIEAYLAAKRG